jgi:predicted Zn-ribbon and HTH transcriptional regulator
MTAEEILKKALFKHAPADWSEEEFNELKNDEKQVFEAIIEAMEEYAKSKVDEALKATQPTFKCSKCGHDKKFWSVKNEAWYCDQCKFYIEGQ